MKKFLFILMFASQLACADNCKVTTVTTENDGKVESQSATVCKENEHVQTQVKVGDMILEDEVGKSKVTKYFNYNNARCRMFQENLPINKELHVYYGVICQTDNTGANWIVVDKW